MLRMTALAGFGAGPSGNDLPAEQGNNIIPTMTAETTSDVTITASEHLAPYLPWRVGDKATGSANNWYSAAGADSTKTLHVDLGSGNQEVVYDYDITAQAQANGDTRAPKDWTLEGSNDDSSWTTLDTVSGETSWSLGENRSFVPDAFGLYRYYRLVITARNGHVNYTVIGELYLFN